MSLIFSLNLQKWLNNRIARLGCWLNGHDNRTITEYPPVGRVLKNYRNMGEIIFVCEPYWSEKIPVKMICRRCGHGSVNHIYRTMECSQDDFAPD